MPGTGAEDRAAAASFETQAQNEGAPGDVEENKGSVKLGTRSYGEDGREGTGGLF